MQWSAGEQGLEAPNEGIPQIRSPTPPLAER